MSIEKYLRDCNPLTAEEMEQMKTRQLLAHLRRTYRWGEWDWTDADCQAKREYQAQIKAVLATREHIPNKNESRGLRKLRKKRGFK